MRFKAGTDPTNMIDELARCLLSRLHAAWRYLVRFDEAKRKKKFPTDKAGFKQLVTPVHAEG